MIEVVRKGSNFSYMVENYVAIYHAPILMKRTAIEFSGIMYDEDGNETEEGKRQYYLPENWRLVI